MFETVLIANRGEIACRVIETARRMGMRTVAVYSDADRDARHVALADQAIRIGGAAPAESYLRGDCILDAARQSGAEAIHPGYGFLSENPDFVEAVVSAGLVFVGPSAGAIRKMGLKDAAKALMSEAGVPVVPGYHGAAQDPLLLAAEAEAIGYPVLIKAVAGGGGKGMRLVEDASGFADALRAAQSEAKTAFGNAAVLIEKYVTQPRHIEVQVFGDGTQAVHLFERDCSLQRRHQKVIEEAPAPGMTDPVRAAMGAAAVRAAEAIGYAGAGTVEFIVDGSGPLRTDGFWFMEMNTRLQVEHPVTEFVTGVDLVEWQFRVAAGEALPCQQEDLALDGHAFEARLYAEDVPAGFLPATGRLAHLAFPDGCRADTGVRSGDEISPHYDPMIAKVIVHGPTRDVALRRLDRALAGTEVAGTVTNLSFLRALARHRGFAAGQVDTGLIARDLDQLVAEPDAAPAHLAQAVWAALGLMSAPGPLDGFALWAPLRQDMRFLWRGEVLSALVKWSGAEQATVTVAGAEVAVHWSGGRWHFDGQGALPWHCDGTVVTVFAAPALTIERVDLLAVETGPGAAAGVIEAPMPGLVRAVFVKAGQAVAAGDALAILEAMKMEHRLVAPRDGTVAEVLTAAEAQVVAGAALIRLDEADGTGDAAS